MPLTVTLPWPDPALRPNASGAYGSHWKATNAKREAKDGAMWATKQAIGVQWGPAAKAAHDGASDIILRQVAHPPDNRARDRDNVDSSLKAARDGISAALGINDRFFRPTGIEWGEPKRGGEIQITIEVEAA